MAATATPSRITDYPATHQGVRNLDQPHQTEGNRDSMAVNVGSNERALSALGGGTLFALGLARGGCLGLGLLWTGAALMLRGMTGHCDVNQAIGRNSAV